jgi:glucose/mannose-6-phosphate isomerase
MAVKPAFDTSPDRENLAEVLLDFPNQFSEYLNLGKGMVLTGHFENIIVQGMGGSALPALLLQQFRLTKIPLFISRSYNLHPAANSRSLVICSSYSGNTEETITAFQAAQRLRGTMLVISTGGELMQRAKNAAIPFVQLPSGYQPRMALGIFTVTLTNVLDSAGLVTAPPEEWAPGVADLLRRQAGAFEKHWDYEIQTRKMAMTLKGKTPLLYASSQHFATAQIAKIILNENSKVPAFWHIFPELNHNEMVGMTTPQAKFHLLIFRDPTDHPRERLRMEITSDLYAQKGIPSTVYNLPGNNIFQRTFAGLYFIMWTSYWLALAYGHDPTPVKMVEDLKRRLRRK